jgi:hypothetical protein
MAGRLRANVAIPSRYAAMTSDGMPSACAYRMKMAADDMANTPMKSMRAIRIGCFKLGALADFS